jgi:hypothetical protein
MYALLQLSKLYQLRESFMKLTFLTLKPNKWFKSLAVLAGTG